MSTETLTIVAKMQAASGQADALEEAMRILVEGTRQEKGCLRYDLFRGTEDDHVFIFVEEWATKADWEAHRVGAPMNAYRACIGTEMIVGRDVSQLRPVS